MALPIPEQPEACRRENARRFYVSLLPATACAACLLTGQWGWALGIFLTTFCLIGYCSIVPGVRAFGPHVSQLPDELAAQQQVWITVDDGPDPTTTPLLLDLLDRYQAKAGFFLIGAKAARHPELVREIAQRGHLIGNHSQTHPAGRFWSLRPARMWEEVAGCQHTLTQILGQGPRWFRPPVGHHNLFLAPPLRALGLTMAIWNCRGFDGVLKDPQLILRLIARSLKPGAIILVHDGPASCVEVLEGTLRLLAARGLQAALPPSLQPASPPPRLEPS